MIPTDEPLALPELWPSGTQVKGDYIIEKRLGAGGFGTVYLARHRFLGTCVIKRLHSQFAADREYVRKFVQEGATIRRLQECPHIVKVHDVTQTEDWHLIIVLEFVPGGDLASLMDKSAMQPDEVVEYARQIAVGLEAAHQAGLVHRDIKPQNVLVGKTASGGPLLKLIDFGIAADRLSQHQTSVFHSGSVGYAAPEQWMKSGKELDGRTDLYALGATMFRMLTGQMPYPDAADIGTWIDRARSNPPRPVHEIRPGINRELSLLVLQLLAVHPADRPPTAAAVISRLDALRIAEAIPSYKEKPSAPQYQQTVTMPPPAAQPGPAKGERRYEPTRPEAAAGLPRPVKQREPERSLSRSRPLVILAAGVAVLVITIGGWKFLTRLPDPPVTVASTPQQDVPIEQHQPKPAPVKPQPAPQPESAPAERKPVQEPPKNDEKSKSPEPPVEAKPKPAEPPNQATPNSPDPLPDVSKVSPPLSDPGTKPAETSTTPYTPDEGPYKIGGGVTSPNLIRKVEPVYPENARKAKVEGDVTIALIIDPEGNPRNIRVVRSLDKEMDRNAIEAVQQWHFTPGHKDGRPVATYATVQVRFRLI